MEFRIRHLNNGLSFVDVDGGDEKNPNTDMPTGRRKVKSMPLERTTALLIEELTKRIAALEGGKPRLQFSDVNPTTAVKAASQTAVTIKAKAPYKRREK